MPTGNAGPLWFPLDASSFLNSSGRWLNYVKKTANLFNDHQNADAGRGLTPSFLILNFAFHQSISGKETWKCRGKSKCQKGKKYASARGLAQEGWRRFDNKWCVGQPCARWWKCQRAPLVWQKKRLQAVASALDACACRRSFAPKHAHMIGQSMCWNPHSASLIGWRSGAHAHSQCLSARFWIPVFISVGSNSIRIH